MAIVTIKLEGIEEFVLRVDQHEEALTKQLKKAITSSSNKVRTIAKREAPVRRGNLRKSIRVKDTSRYANRPRGLAKTVTARRGGAHLAFVHGGTGDRKANRTVHARLNGRIVRLGPNRGRMKANPFLTRAENAVMSQHQAKIRAIVMQRKEL